MYSTHSALVVVRHDTTAPSSSALPFSPSARVALDLLAALTAAAMDQIAARQLRTMAYGSSLTSTLLAALDDYVVLMDADGYVVGWNRDLRTLLGEGSGGSEGGKGAEGDIAQEHIFWFLKALHSPSLHADVSRRIADRGRGKNGADTSTDISTDTGADACAKATVLSSVVHPTGLPIEYHFRSMPSPLPSLTPPGDASHAGGGGFVLVIRTRAPPKCHIHTAACEEAGTGTGSPGTMTPSLAVGSARTAAVALRQRSEKVLNPTAIAADCSQDDPRNLILLALQVWRYA